MLLYIYLFVLFLGGVLMIAGYILMQSALSFKASDFSWEKTKEAFREMFHNRRFQIGAVCFIVGLAICMYCLSY